MFSIADYKRYSWYVRLADAPPAGTRGPGSCGARPRASSRRTRRRAIADRTAAVLPMVASEPHVDPRAPQNLVPIAALERDLRTAWATAGSCTGPCARPSMEREAS